MMLLRGDSFIDCNAAALKMFGCSSVEEFCTHHPADVSPPQQPCGGDSWRLARQHLREISRQDTSLFEWTHQRFDGTTFPAEVLISRIYVEGEPLMVASVRDITERHHDQEQLRKLSSAVEQSPASVLITDLEGTIEYVNPAFCRLTGYTAEEAIGENPRILQSGVHTPEFYHQMWKVLLDGEQWRGEICNRKKNGELFWEYASIVAARDGRAQITHYVAVKEDITERRQSPLPPARASSG